MALSFCYYYRISNKESRILYRNTIGGIIGSYLSADSFGEIMKQEQRKYLDEMEIPEGIGKNTPL